MLYCNHVVAHHHDISEHAKELGNAVPKSPFFFLKPTSSYLANGGTIEIPNGCDVHHESKLQYGMPYLDA